MQLCQVEHFCIVLQLPFREEKSVQLVRVAFFRSDFLQNPYFNDLTQKVSPLNTFNDYLAWPRIFVTNK